METVPISDLVAGFESTCICVRASRVWYFRGGLDDGEVKDIRMVLTDEKGQSIYATVPNNLVPANISVLHETFVYNLCFFEVSSRQGVMSVVENPLVIVFTAFPVVQLVIDPEDAFPLWTYRLTSFQDLPAPTDVPRRFIDVIGVIRAISYVIPCAMSGRTAPTYKRQIVLADASANETNVTLWGEAVW